MPFIPLTSVELQQDLIPGFDVRFVHSENMTFAFWDIKAGSLLPEHAHPHEQVANVLDGEFELTIDGQTQRVTPGTIAVIPGNTTHSGRAVTDCKVVDVFNPVREDYRNYSVSR